MNNAQRGAAGVSLAALLFFFFCAVFASPTLARDETIEPTADYLNPPIHHEDIRILVEDVRKYLLARLSSIDENIERVTAALILADDPVLRRELVDELEELTRLRSETIAVAVAEIGDLRVRDVERSVEKLATSPKPVIIDRMNLSRIQSSLDDLFAPETEFGGYLKMRCNTDIVWDNPREDLFEMHPKAYVKLRHPVSDNLSFFVSAHGQYEVYTGGRTHYDYEVELDEAYLDVSFGSFDIRIGNQVFAWGRTDIINPTDNLNALNVTNFLTGDTEERRIPVFALKMDYYRENTVFELGLVPFYQDHEMALWGSDWALYRPGIVTEYSGGYLPYSEVIDDESMEVLDWVVRNYSSPNPPSYSLENLQGGVRISSKFKGWDFSVSYAYLFDKIPTIYFSDGLYNAIENGNIPGYIASLPIYELTESAYLEHKRLHVVGLDFATTWGAYGIRGEGALFLGAYTYTDVLRPTQKNYLRYVIGVDRIFGENLYVNLQLVQKIIFDYDGDLLEEEVQNMLTLSANKKFFNDTLIPEVTLSYNITDGDFYITPKVTYKYTDTLEFTLGANIYNGDPYTIFGLFEHNDQFFLEIKYHF
ncbi:MAG: hypothetical protein JW885_05090 [Deltaproteobacteria bacterium]|nr:hypothetical protein [Candidatus Zymogenaceae bacterium]